MCLPLETHVNRFVIMCMYMIMTILFCVFYGQEERADTPDGRTEQVETDGQTYFVLFEQTYKANQ